MQKIILRIFLVAFQSFLFIAITGCTTTDYEGIPNTATTPSLTAISLTLTPTISATPAETVAPTATEKPPASTEWHLSPDGHVVYNESQLYEGMFTINKEHPEYVEKYWEELVRGLWNLNSIGENEAFLSQFPTDDSLVDHFRNGGKPISNMLIPSIYPVSKQQYFGSAELLPTKGSIDLSKIAISIYKPTTEEIYKYSPSPSSGTKYIHFLGGGGSVWIQEKEFEGQNILSMTYRKDLLMDKQKKFPITDQQCTGGEWFIVPALQEDKSPEENLLAATQLLRYWPLQMQMKEFCDMPLFYESYDPPLLAIVNSHMMYQAVEDITTLDGTPLALR